MAARHRQTPARRRLSSEKNSHLLELYDSVVDKLVSAAPALHAGLSRCGYHQLDGFVAEPRVQAMRDESVALRRAGAFFQSSSEAQQDDGTTVRFDKPGVFACELDGDEMAQAPALLHYTAAVMHTLPALLNQLDPQLAVSMAAYGTKLAVTEPGSPGYPKHLDNVGLPDQRKLTVILYLNPAWATSAAGRGGELRLWGCDAAGAEQCEDVSPDGGRLVVFWSDMVVHEVLPCLCDHEHRYALTLWLVTDDRSSIGHNAHPTLLALRDAHFPPDTEPK